MILIPEGKPVQSRGSSGPSAGSSLRRGGTRGQGSTQHGPVLGLPVQPSCTCIVLAGRDLVYTST
jgi:hypothetical protein